jgi:hypothetical protein
MTPHASPPAAFRVGRMTSADLELRAAVIPFQQPVLWKSLWQAASSIAAFGMICAAMLDVMSVC